TKAARLRAIAGDDAKLLEFGTRRAFSPQGALWAARAALAGGFDATSNVAAALKLGQRPSGTMAHSLVMAIGALEGGEDDAFEAFGRYFPEAPLLIDTFNPLAAAERLAAQVAANRRKVTGVRLDSGEIACLSRQVRDLLPAAAIFASGDMDETEIARLQAAEAAIDGYGIGTRLVTGTTLNGVYKLVEIDGIATMKQSSHKATYPGRKQVFRRTASDRLGLATEAPQPDERPLLELVMSAGSPLQAPEPIEAIRQRTRQSVASLPARLRRLEEQQEPWSVDRSPALMQLTQTVEARLAAAAARGAIAP
ncbi:MAG: nicotinate phosphoribosyltransferase, partial [Cyanobacteria bacterium J06641_5]